MHKNFFVTKLRILYKSEIYTVEKFNLRDNSSIEYDKSKFDFVIDSNERQMKLVL